MVTESYPTVPLAKFDGRPTGKAMFNEPVFRRGVFQDRYIEVEVTVYSGEVYPPGSRQKMVPVRFGEMQVVRFVDEKLLFGHS